MFNLDTFIWYVSLALLKMKGDWEDKNGFRMRKTRTESTSKGP